MTSQDEKRTAPEPESATIRLAYAATFLVLMGVVALQWRAASMLFGSSLQGDAAKHFTSGVMVYDYLRTGMASKPLPFAEQFEVHYPLVAIGQWPPMYYAIQAVYYFLAGPFTRSAEVLSALMAALLASLIFASLKGYTGVRIALLGAGVFLATPLVQVSAWEVMSDLLTGLFVYLSIRAFANLLDAPGNLRPALSFAAWAVAAILSKGSAWALAPFFALAPALARRDEFYKSRWFLGASIAVAVLGSAFYFLAARIGIGYPMFLSYFLTVGINTRLSTLRQVLQFAPLSLLVLGTIGGVVAIRARWSHNDQSQDTTLSLVAAAWIASQLIFFSILPMTREPRTMLPALAPLAILAAGTMRWLQGLLRQTPIIALTVPTGLAAIVLANSISSGLHRVDGFHQVADAMPYPANGALILVATNHWAGEEELIAERLSHSREHRDVILRGSHVLANLNLEETTDEPLYQGVEEVRQYLLRMPVRFVVLGTPPYQYSFQALLESAVLGDPQDFHEIAKVPIVAEPGGVSVGELRVYENPAGRDHHPDVVRTKLGAIGGRRVLEYQWK